MSWTDIYAKVKTLLLADGFKESIEFFDVENLPASVSHKMFSIQMAEMTRDPETSKDNTAQFYPTRQIQVDVIYEVGNQSLTLYNAAIGFNDRVIQLLIDPANLPTSERIVEFVSATPSLTPSATALGSWLVVKNIFTTESTLIYPLP